MSVSRGAAALIVHVLPACMSMLTTTPTDYRPSAGLAALIQRHTHCIADSREQVYGVINQEGLREYGPSFQVRRYVFRSTEMAYTHTLIRDFITAAVILTATDWLLGFIT